MDTDRKTISAGAIEEYNYMVQASKPEEERQFSFEKLGIEDWEVKDFSADEILKLGAFVETSGAVPPAYAFWKLFGRKVTLEDIVDEVIKRKDEIPEEAKPWVENLVSLEKTEEKEEKLQELEEKVKKGEIDPPLLFFPSFSKKTKENLGLLNMGNILDGNHRLMNVVYYLRKAKPEEVKNFKLTVFVGRVDIMKYVLFNAYYMTEPWINSSKNFVKSFMGKDVEKINPKYVMNFFERWYLLLQRIGFYKHKHGVHNTV